MRCACFADQVARLAQEQGSNHGRPIFKKSLETGALNESNGSQPCCHSQARVLPFTTGMKKSQPQPGAAPCPLPFAPCRVLPSVARCPMPGKIRMALTATWIQYLGHAAYLSKSVAM